MHCTHYPRVLSIAGSDSGGGAGIQADLKTFSALGCFGMTAITAITAQNTVGVHAIHPVPPEVLLAQISAVAQDIGCDAVKIGMLHNLDAIRVVAQALHAYSMGPVILDPVMISTSGAPLMQPDACESVVQSLFPMAALVTPNLDEAAWLLGRPVESVDDLAPAARAILAMGAQAVLLKGGHLKGASVVDVLLAKNGEPLFWQASRIESHNVHGTGCTLSSAIAAHMALGLALGEAVENARQFVRHAIEAGAGVVTGAGHGPLNHHFSPQPLRAKNRTTHNSTPSCTLQNGG